MLSELKFVMGAVAKKEFIPSLTHFVIENGHVRGYNGTLALSSPIPFDIACKPKAANMVKAIANCSDTIALSITAAGRLKISSGSFKVFVDCVTGDTPHLEPEGKPISIPGEALVKALTAVEPFIGDDASRPWACGALLSGKSVYATCNVALVEYWLGQDVPPMCIPRAAVAEIVRIKETPTHAQYTDSSLTLHYENGRWIRTQLLDVAGWPNLEKILNQESNQIPLDKKLFDGLDVLRNHVDKMGRVFFVDGNLETHLEPDEGATFEMHNWPFEGCYNIEILRLLSGVADTIDFSTYPRPCMFQGGGLRGALVGMRINAE